MKVLNSILAITIVILILSVFQLAAEEFDIEMELDRVQHELEFEKIRYEVTLDEYNETVDLYEQLLVEQSDKMHQIVYFSSLLANQGNKISYLNEYKDKDCNYPYCWDTVVYTGVRTQEGLFYIDTCTIVYNEEYILECGTPITGHWKNKHVFCGTGEYSEFLFYVTREQFTIASEHGDFIRTNKY